MNDTQKRVAFWLAAIVVVWWVMAYIVIPIVSFIYHLISLPFEVLWSVVSVFIP